MSARSKRWVLVLVLACLCVFLGGSAKEFKKHPGPIEASDVEVDQSTVSNLQDLIDIHNSGMSTGAIILYETLALKEVATIAGLTERFFATSAASVTAGGAWGAPDDANGPGCVSRALPCLTTDQMETSCVDDDNCILKDGDTWIGATNFNDGIQLVPTSADTSDITLMLSGEIPVADGGTRPILDCTGQLPNDSVINVTPGAASGKVLIQNLDLRCSQLADTFSPDPESDVVFLNMAVTQEIPTDDDPGTNAAIELPHAASASSFVCINCTGSANNYHWMRIRGQDADDELTVLGGSATVYDDQHQTAGVISVDSGGAADVLADVAIIGTTVSHEDPDTDTGNAFRYGLNISTGIATGFQITVAGLTVDGIDTTDGNGAAYGIYSEGDNSVADYTLNLYGTVVNGMLANGENAYGVQITGSAIPAQTRTINILGLVTEDLLSTGLGEIGINIDDFNEVTQPTIMGSIDCVYTHQTPGSDNAWFCTDCIGGASAYDTCAELSDPDTGLSTVTSLEVGERCGAIPTTESYLIGGAGTNALDPDPGGQAAGECDRAINIRLPAVIPNELRPNSTIDATHLMFHNYSEIRRVVALCRDGGCQ